MIIIKSNIKKRTRFDVVLWRMFWISALVGGLSSSVFAKNNTVAKTGVVLGVQGGYAQPNLSYNGSLPVKFDKGNFYGGVNAGFEYALTHMFAVGAETGVFYGSSISKIKSTDMSYKVSDLIFPVMGVGRLVTPIGINLFLKGGVAYVNPSVDRKGNDFGSKWSSAWEPIGAAGVGYQIGIFNIFAQYAHIFGNKEVKFFGSHTDAAAIDAVTLGFSATI